MTKRSPEQTIRAGVLAAIVQNLRKQGAPIEQLLHQHVPDVAVFDNPYTLIPLVHFVAFLEEAARLLQDPALGVKLGALFQPQDMGPLGIMCVASANLRIALGNVGTFCAVWQSGTREELDDNSEMPSFIYKIVDPAIWPRRQDAELSLAAYCAVIRVLLRPHWNPVEVHFEHERNPEHTRGTEAALLRIFRAPILYGQTVNRLVLSPGDLVRPVASRGVEILPFIKRHLEDLMSTHEGTFDSCTAQVSHIISKRLRYASFNVNSIAQEMGLSPRTLQRRLTLEGTSFRDLVRRHRSQIVDKLLQDSKAKMTAIAHDVGYSGAAALSRAFKNWRGQCPRDHRPARARR